MAIGLRTSLLILDELIFGGVYEKCNNFQYTWNCNIRVNILNYNYSIVQGCSVLCVFHRAVRSITEPQSHNLQLTLHVKRSNWLDKIFRLIQRNYWPSCW
jgi:hypothetical protein